MGPDVQHPLGGGVVVVPADAVLEPAQDRRRVAQADQGGPRPAPAQVLEAGEEGAQAAVDGAQLGLGAPGAAAELRGAGEAVPRRVGDVAARVPVRAVPLRLERGASPPVVPLLLLLSKKPLPHP